MYAILKWIKWVGNRRYENIIKLTICFCFVFYNYWMVWTILNCYDGRPSVRQIVNDLAPFWALFYFVCHFVCHYLLDSFDVESFSQKLFVIAL